VARKSKIVPKLPMLKALVHAGMGLVALGSNGQGQQLLDEVNFRQGQFGGVRLYGVSVFSGYSSSAYPVNGSGGIVAPGSSALGSDVTYGATASVGWQHHRNRTDLSVLYSGTYSGMSRYSNLNAFNHSLAIQASRTLRRKWTIAATAGAQDSTLTQFIYAPSNSSVLSQVPATFDDLAASFSIGQFSSSQVASMLSGTTALDTPARSLLLGNRVLSYSAQASLAYAATSRLSFHFGSFAAAGQHLASKDSATVPNYLMPRSMGATAGVGLSYALSSRTQLGASFEEYRQTNAFQNAYVSTATASVGRKMTEHWFVDLSGGGSVIQVTKQPNGTPQTRQIVGSGSLGYRTYRHTLLASYNRSSFSSFGFSAGTNTAVGGNWNWHRPGSLWSVFAGFGQQQTRNTGFASFSGWQTSTGLSRTMSEHTVVSAQYVYLSSSGNYLGTLQNLSIHSLRVSFGWNPQPNVR
jgi:hypothetical protein